MPGADPWSCARPGQQATMCSLGWNRGHCKGAERGRSAGATLTSTMSSPQEVAVRNPQGICPPLGDQGSLVKQERARVAVKKKEGARWWGGCCIVLIVPVSLFSHVLEDLHLPFCN